jgi:hypothetical protein
LVIFAPPKNEVVMRIVKEIPHPRFKITVFSWNGKYLVKVEDAHLEQVFKIPESEIQALDEIDAMLSTAFLLRCLERFSQMGADFNAAWRQRHHPNPTFPLS